MKNQNRKSTIYLKMALGESVHTATLAKEFGVSIRTIQNDINELKEVYEIISEKKGYYRLKEIPKMFDEEKINMVKLLLYSVGKSMFKEFEEEIKAILKVDEEICIFDTHIEKIENLNDFKVIVQMLKWNYSIECEYKEKKRILHPFKIANLSGYWYLIAFDLKNNKLKSFLLNKIKNIKPAFENLLANDNLEHKIKSNLKHISPWIKDTQKEVKLIIYHPLNETLKRALPHNTTLIKHSQDYSIIKFHYYDEREALRFISAYIPYVKIEDEKLKKSFLEMIEKFKESL